eukprot:GHVU01222477.1.p3 GENE.GHVU01222477.1~~GHVU01222477.1.p3  ORF type:complete len:140 (-),score=16.16 GHVU01222477.1:377-796(-)
MPQKRVLAVSPAALALATQIDFRNHLEDNKTEVEHPRVFIDTYSSAYWQLPLRMYRHIRRLYDPPVHTAIYWIEMYMMKEKEAALDSGLPKKTRRLHENRDPGTVFTLPHFATSSIRTACKSSVRATSAWALATSASTQ